MSAVFIRSNQEPIGISDSWSLEEQIVEINDWLTKDANAASVYGATLDIGFNSRLNGKSIAVQGETIPVAFMRRLVDSEITLWLSLYPPLLKPFSPRR